MIRPIITNGEHAGWAIGFLPRWDGSRVPVWSMEPLELARAELDAIGPPPVHPVLGPGGSCNVIKDETGLPIQYIYDPAGDALNASEVEMYKADLEAHNAHALIVQSVVQSLIQEKK